MNQVFRDNKAFNEIIQIGAVICDRQFNEIQSYTSLIRSTSKLRGIVKKLTGLQDRDFDQASDFITGIEYFMDWTNRYGCDTVMQWSKSDRIVLLRQCSHYKIEIPKVFKDSWIDAQKIVDKDFTLTGKQLQLQRVAEMVQVERDGKYHDALQDALCMKNILKMRFDKHPKYVRNTLEGNPTKHKIEIERYIDKLEAKRNKLLRRIGKKESQIEQIMSIKDYDYTKEFIEMLKKLKDSISNLDKQIKEYRNVLSYM